MASPMNETWWSTFLTQHGRDSEEEQAFLGYLTTQTIPPGSDPGLLDEAYAGFHQYMLASGARASADPGPTRQEVMAQQAVATLVETVPQSRTANPGMDKPLTAATHPQAQEVATVQRTAAARQPEPTPEGPREAGHEESIAHPEAPAAGHRPATPPESPRGSRRSGE